MNNKEALILFKGDDTTGALGRTVRLTLTAEDASAILGATAVITVGGVEKRIVNVTSGTEYVLEYSASETDSMPLGGQYGEIYVIDAAGNKRTLTNTLRVLVTNNVGVAYAARNDVEVAVGTGIAVVTPDAEAEAGQAADAKATYEALESKIGTDRLSPPDAAARQYDVADAKSTYEAILEHSSPVRKYVVVSGKYEEDQMPAFIDMEEGLAYDADPDSQGKPFPKPTELLRGGDTVFELYNPMGYQDGIDLWFNGYIVVLGFGYTDVYEYSCPLGAIMPVDTMWLTARVADAGDGEKILILDLI